MIHISLNIWTCTYLWMLQMHLIILCVNALLIFLFSALLHHSLLFAIPHQLSPFSLLTIHNSFTFFFSFHHAFLFLSIYHFNFFLVIAILLLSVVSIYHSYPSPRLPYFAFLFHIFLLFFLWLSSCLPPLSSLPFPRPFFRRLLWSKHPHYNGDRSLKSRSCAQERNQFSNFSAEGRGCDSPPWFKDSNWQSLPLAGIWFIARPSKQRANVATFPFRGNPDATARKFFAYSKNEMVFYPGRVYYERKVVDARERVFQKPGPLCQINVVAQTTCSRILYQIRSIAVKSQHK